MNIEKLRIDRDQARKNGDHLRMTTLNEMIDAIQKASMAGKVRVDMTDKLIDETLIKYQKIIQEIIDTCPGDREDILDNAYETMKIVKEYAPQLINDKDEIRSLIIMTLSGLNIPLEKNQRGNIMKILAKEFKGKADMSIVSSIVGEMLT